MAALLARHQSKLEAWISAITGIHAFFSINLKMLAAWQSILDIDFLYNLS